MSKGMVIDPAVFMSELSELEKEYYLFLDVAQTFNGWVLGLNEVEFRDLMVDFNLYKSRDNKVPPKYGVLELLHKGETEFKSEDFEEDLLLKGLHLKKLSLCKDGFMSYKVAAKDEDWEFKITKLGIEHLDQITGWVKN